MNLPNPEADPFRVFGDEYWGAVYPCPEGRESGPSSIRAAAVLAKQIKSFIRPIIKGELHGLEISPGVNFDPVNAEPDLSFYYPGTVLLMDSEVLRPAQPDYSYVEEVDEGLLGQSPRGFLRDQVKTLDDSQRQRLVPRAKWFTDGEQAYGRRVDIIALDHNRRRGNSMYKVGSWITNPATPVLADRLLLAPASLPGGRSRSVGETYEASAGIGGIARIRSLEVCVTGQPVPAGTSRLSVGFLQRSLSRKPESVTAGSASQ